MDRKHHLLQALSAFLWVAAGNFLYALAVKLFLLPVGFGTDVYKRQGKRLY